MTKTFLKYSNSLAVRGVQVRTVLRAHTTRQNGSHVENEVCNMVGYFRFLRKNEVAICGEMHAAGDNHITETESAAESQIPGFLSLVVPRFHVDTHNHIYVCMYAHACIVKVEAKLLVEDNGDRRRKTGEKKEEQTYVGCSTVYTCTKARKQ